MLRVVRDMNTWFLEGKSRNSSKWIIPVDKTPFIIGRNNKSDLVLTSKTVSRKHAEISTISNMIFIKDLDSTNGSYVNRHRIKHRTMADAGDLFQFGEFEFRIIRREDCNESINDSAYTLSTKSPLLHDDFKSHYDLTKREEEIMYYVIEGKSTKEIAYELNISFGTAKNHIYNMFKKINIHSRMELVARYNNFCA